MTASLTVPYTATSTLTPKEIPTRPKMTRLLANCFTLEGRMSAELKRPLQPVGVEAVAVHLLHIARLFVVKNGVARQYK